MNPLQRIVGAIGVACIVLAGMFPVWEIWGKVRYDYKQTFDDSGRAVFFSENTDFSRQKRDFMFFDRDRVPAIPYIPTDIRGFDDKKGYFTVSCVNHDIADYGYGIDIKQMAVEILLILIPTLLLMFVFSGSRGRD